MNFQAHEKLFDIEWFDGPMLSLFSDSKGELFIYKWVNVNPDSHTWLVFHTTNSLVTAYFQQDISERALILLAPDKRWHLIDINPALEISRRREISAQTLRQTVLPNSHIFFNVGNFPESDKLQLFISKEMFAV